MSESYRNAARYIGFVALNTAASAAMTYAVCRALPLRGAEAMVVLPIAVLAGVACLALYPLLRRQRTSLRRLAAFYLAFVGVTAAFGVYFLSSLTFAAGGLVNAAEAPLQAFVWNVGYGMWGGIALGHLYGLAPFLALVVLNAAFTPLFFPKSASAR